MRYTGKSKKSLDKAIVTRFTTRWKVDQVCQPSWAQMPSSSTIVVQKRAFLFPEQFGKSCKSIRAFGRVEGPG